MERGLQEWTGEVNIEDLWLPYFCVSTNHTTSEMHVHRTELFLAQAVGNFGSGWTWLGPEVVAIRASVFLPGMLAPVIEEENLLVEGGLRNNLPGDVMRELFGGAVIVADMQSVSDLRVRSHRMPSPQQALKTASSSPAIRKRSLGFWTF